MKHLINLRNTNLSCIMKMLIFPCSSEIFGSHDLYRWIGVQQVKVETISHFFSHRMLVHWEPSLACVIITASLLKNLITLLNL